MKNRVLVLMSTYNGEIYLREQLNSLIEQKKVELSVLIRDDGSTDSTVEIIKEYAKKYNYIKYYVGNNIGYAHSFWDLVKKAGIYDYYAFCDQDDIWDKNKLYYAIKILENESKNIPLLYCSRVKSVDNNMNMIDNDTFKNHNILTIYESLQKSTVPGCVMVFNNEACKYLKMYNGFMESHDWLTYIIVTLFGKVVFDENSYINYRIHLNNTIGKNNKFKDFLNKLKRFFSKPKCTRSKVANDIYITYSNFIKNDEIRKNIYYLGNYKQNLATKNKILFNSKYKGIIFKIYIVLNKV